MFSMRTGTTQRRVAISVAAFLVSVGFAVCPLVAQEAVDLPPVRTSITVVAKVEAETPVSVTESTLQELEQTAGVNLDEKLGALPGFSLYRRFSSIVSHPTAQGVSLRGIGPTGASRTLVRWDGIPVNDPFGGWVQWTRFPPEGIDRVETLRGAGTSAFGDRAMGGTASIFSRPVEATRVLGAYEGGSDNTHQASLSLAWLGRRLALSGDGRAFTTDGYYVIPERNRGTVDRKANVRFVAGDTRLDVFGDRSRLFLKFDLLAEERSNGTVAQRNSTSLGTLSAHYSREWQRDGISVIGYHTREEFRNTFSAVSDDRNSETPTTQQRVPADSTGGAGMWRHSDNGWATLLGSDFHRVQGASHDHVLTTGFRRVAGGELLQHGYFGQADVQAGPARLYAGARFQFADQGRRFFSPNAGVTIGRGVLRVRGSVYRAFRVPTLNELYRPFRVGNVVTNPNEDLETETLLGTETGIDLIGETRRFSLTVFRAELDDLISNVTLEVTPTLIIRQRQNAGGAVARGVEADFSQRWRAFTGGFSYLFSNSRFDDGLRVPQVPLHQGSARVSYSRGRTLLASELRAYSSQWEDDLNAFLLPGFAVVHIRWQLQVGRNVSVMASVENVLNREYVVGFSPDARVGAPRMWRAGLRWNSGI